MKRSIQRFARLNALVLVVSALVACDFFGSTNNNSFSDLDALAALDIAGAKSLFIAPAAGASSAAQGLQASNATRKTLFKVTDGGFAQEVTYSDQDGNPVTLVKDPSAIYRVNATYLVVVFEDEYGYLVRSSDGAAFSLREVGNLALNPQLHNFLNAPRFQTDSAGNLYYKARPNNGAVVVIRVDVTDPENPTAQTWAQVDSKNIESFWVSPLGHVIYSSFRNTVQTHRIRNATTGRIYADLPEATGMPVWVGTDGNFKYVHPSTNKITTAVIDTSGTMSTTEGASANSSITTWSSYLFRFGSRTIAVDREHLNSSVAELENGANTPRGRVNFPSSVIKDITDAFASENYYYLIGKNAGNKQVLIRVNPQTDETKSLLNPGEYDIFKAGVSETDVITFNAQRFSDGAFVIGEISSTATDREPKILKEDLGGKVINLIRVN